VKKRYLSILIIIAVLLTSAGSLVWIAASQKTAPTGSNSVQSTPTSSTILTTTVTTTANATTTTVKTTVPVMSTTPVPQLDKWIYYPVDKTTALLSTFVPDHLVKLIANGVASISVDFQMRSEVINDLKELFNDAKANGYNLKVLSPYRSYATQEATFTYWKNLELQKGLSDADADKEANRSSAKAGHSEHQLGTTCDVVSSTDSTLDTTSTNQKVWTWMDANLVKHGFVLSYPDGKETQTGYVSEPWHIRWVGKDIAAQIAATDYLNPGNNNTSTSFLKTYWAKLNS